MSSKYWIKLYHEVLDDPKMGMLPDNLWRRTIELFLLAGELSIDKPEDDRGDLPPTQELAWRLRRSAAELDQELEQLARINIVTKTETGWIVTKFAERQKAVPASERMRQLRERKQKDKVAVTTDKDVVTRSVTKSNTDIESDIDKDSSSKEAAKAPLKPHAIPAVQVFVEVTGKYCLSKPQMKEVSEVIGDTPTALEKWRNVVKEWVVMNGYKPTRLSGMLEWFKDGIPPKQNGAKHNGQYKSTKQQQQIIPPPPAEQERLLRMQAALAGNDPA